MSLFLLRNAQQWSFARTGRAGRQWFGLNDHMGQRYNAYLTSSITFRDLNARVIRDGIQWDWGEPTAGNYKFKPSGGETAATDIFAFFAEQVANGYDMMFYYPIGLYGNGGVYPTDSASPAWQQHLADFAVSCATEWLAAGYPANRIIFELWNEPNSPNFGDYGWDSTHGAAAVNYSRTCKVLRDSLKAVNSQIRVAWGAMADGDAGFYNEWRGYNEADTASYFPGMDILSNHPYYEPYPVNTTPEPLFARCAPYFTQQLANAVAAGRPDITTSISETGWQAIDWGVTEVAARCSRGPLLFSMLPGLEFYIYYVMRDNDNDYGICESDAYTHKHQVAGVLRDVFATANIATARTQYTDPRGGVAIKMAVPDVAGRERVALWNTLGSTVADVSVETYATGGTLSVMLPGVGVEAMHPLALGVNKIPGVKMGPHARILSADTPIKFVSMP